MYKLLLYIYLFLVYTQKSSDNFSCMNFPVFYIILFFFYSTYCTCMVWPFLANFECLCISSSQSNHIKKHKQQNIGMCRYFSVGAYRYFSYIQKLSAETFAARMFLFLVQFPHSRNITCPINQVEQMR